MSGQSTEVAASPIAGYYSRNSSGFVRDISTGSAIAMNLSFMGIAFAVLVATQEPFAFPHGDFFWTTVIAAVLCIVPMTLYGKFLAGMPRSGGDYIFVGRSLHPWVGLAANVNISIWYILNTANLAYLVPTFGLSTAFATIGATTHNATITNWAADMAEKGWGFGIAVVVLLLVTLSVSLKAKTTIRIVVWLFVLSIIGVVVALVVLLFSSRASFIHVLPQFGGTYQGVLDAAHKASYDTHATPNFGGTLLAMPLAFSAFGYAMVTAYTGGEVQSVRKSGLRGILYALGIGAVLTALIAVLSDKVFGSHFLGAATFLSNTSSHAYPFKAPSFFFFFVSMVAHNSVVSVVIGISFVAAIVATLPPTYLAVTRSMFAWSFDRVFPQRLGTVNERTRSPLIANMTFLVIALAYLIFLVYGPDLFLQILYTITAGQILTFLAVAVAAVVLPWRAPQLFDQIPIARKHILGIPSISLLGVASFLIYVLFLYPLLFQDSLGANAHSGLIALAVIVAISVLVYPVSRYVNARRGIDLSIINKGCHPNE